MKDIKHTVTSVSVVPSCTSFSAGKPKTLSTVTFFLIVLIEIFYIYFLILLSRPSFYVFIVFF